MDRAGVTRILRLREGGAVRRCHTFPHHGVYTVAEHSYHMAVLLLELHPAPTMGMLHYILLHDVLERWTGDAPATIKIWNPEFKSATRKAEEVVSSLTGIRVPDPVDEVWMKALDTIEFVLWCDDQIGLGNKAAQVRRRETEEWLLRNWDRVPKECREFLEHYEWRRTRDDLA